MAKPESETERLRDEEREIETQAAYAGGGEEDKGGFEQFKYPECEEVDDMAVARRVVDKAAEDGEGESGPGVGGGGTSSEKDF